MSESRTLAESLSAFVDARLRGLHVSMPAKVLKYTKETQTVDVQPVIRQGYTGEDGSRSTEQLPAILDVPVEFPGSGDWGMTFPIGAGDTVLLVFTDYSIATWLGRTGTDIVDPLDDRGHTLSDAVAIPGIRTFVDATDQVDDSALVIRGNSIKLGSKDASELLALKSDLATLQTYLNTHTHSGVTTGGGISGPPTTTAPTPVGTVKTKAE